MIDGKTVDLENLEDFFSEEIRKNCTMEFIDESNVLKVHHSNGMVHVYILTPEEYNRAKKAYLAEQEETKHRNKDRGTER